MDQHAVLSIINELENQIQLLIQKNSVLNAKNVELKTALNQKKADVFEHLDTNDRIAMKAKVDHLLKKIDQQIKK
jgi:regulator of replication initiation timing